MGHTNDGQPLWNVLASSMADGAVAEGPCRALVEDGLPERSRVYWPANGRVREQRAADRCPTGDHVCRGLEHCAGVATGPVQHMAAEHDLRAAVKTACRINARKECCTR